jgi:hypothetical protein
MRVTLRPGSRRPSQPIRLPNARTVEATNSTLFQTDRKPAAWLHHQRTIADFPVEIMRNSSNGQNALSSTDTPESALANTWQRIDGAAMTLL